ncbi:MAG: hypothetical protein PVG64_04480, partial [Syntrophobacterales bacterium]
MKRTRISTFLFFPLVMLPLLLPTSSGAEDPMRGPWDWPTKRPAAERKQVKPTAAASFFTSMLTFFQTVISPVDGDR